MIKKGAEAPRRVIVRMIAIISIGLLIAKNIVTQLSFLYKLFLITN